MSQWKVIAQNLPFPPILLQMEASMYIYCLHLSDLCSFVFCLNRNRQVWSIYSFGKRKGFTVRIPKYTSYHCLKQAENKLYIFKKKIQTLRLHWNFKFIEIYRRKYPKSHFVWEKEIFVNWVQNKYRNHENRNIQSKKI